MDDQRQQLPAEIQAYIDEKIAHSLKRQAHAAIREKIERDRSYAAVPVHTKLLFAFYIVLFALAGFLLVALLQNLMR